MPFNFSPKYLAIALLTLTLSYFGWKTFSKLDNSSQDTLRSGDVFFPGSYYQVSIPSSKNKNNQYLSADYKVWIPDEIDEVRGILVKQHGCGNDAARSGLEHANDLQWQALALKHQLALMGTQLLVGDEKCVDWALINYGSKDTFLQAIDTVGEQSERSELNQVPWVFWGHSGGADWAAQMLQEYPERTIAVVCLRAGGFAFLGTNPSLTNIPVLFSLGENDMVLPYETVELPQTVFRRYRKLGALWSLAIEANAGHETGNSRFLAIPYLDAIITARLTKNSNKLRSIDSSQGWLADNVTHKIAPADQFAGNPLEATWLPNKEIAEKWQEYVTTGKISPTRKPDPPTNVNATKINPTEVVITWNFTPDLENGLPSFRIYRNNSLIHTLERQSQSFGDISKTAHTALEFRDQKAIPNSAYSVAAFNKLGESVSQPTKLIVEK